jgi:hypothetical protein
MMKPEADIEPFGKFVEAIDPWLEQKRFWWEAGRIVSIATTRAQDTWSTFRSRRSMEMSPFRENSKSKNRRCESA